MDNNERQERYLNICHAIQSATKFLITQAQMRSDDGLAGSSPKHLRTGLNMVMADVSSLATLLIKKGVFTEEEYFEAVLIGAENELERLTNMANAGRKGPRITFG